MAVQLLGFPVRFTLLAVKKTKNRKKGERGKKERETSLAARGRSPFIPHNRSLALKYPLDKKKKKKGKEERSTGPVVTLSSIILLMLSCPQKKKREKKKRGRRKRACGGYGSLPPVRNCALGRDDG